VIIGLVAALAATSCSEADSDGGSAETPWLEVGHGLDSYAPFEASPELAIVLGSQGGWHVDLATQFGGRAPEGFVVYRIWDRDHVQQVAYPIKASVSDDVVDLGDGGYAQVGIRTVFAIDDPSEVVGERWLVEAEWISGPEVLVDEREVLLTAP
jgi:hypothetical protein